MMKQTNVNETPFHHVMMFVSSCFIIPMFFSSGAQGAQVGDDRPRGSHGRLHGASHAAARHLQEIPEIYGGFHKWGIPLNGWFIMKNPIN